MMTTTSTSTQRLNLHNLKPYSLCTTTEVRPSESAGLEGKVLLQVLDDHHLSGFRALEVQGLRFRGLGFKGLGISGLGVAGV